MQSWLWSAANEISPGRIRPALWGAKRSRSVQPPRKQRGRGKRKERDEEPAPQEPDPSRADDADEAPSPRDDGEAGAHMFDLILIWSYQSITKHLPNVADRVCVPVYYVA